MSGGAIKDRTESALRSLEALAEYLSDASDLAWAEKQVMGINLWSAKLGVFATDNLSVDHRLRKNQAVLRGVLRLLSAIINNLRSYTPMSTANLSTELKLIEQ